MILRRLTPRVVCLLLCCLLANVPVYASLGDRLGEFKDCLQTCQEANCVQHVTSIRE